VLRYENDVQPQHITQLRVDGFNQKIDIHTKDKFLRFKALDHMHVLRMNPATGLMEKVLDPALAAGINYLGNKLVRK